MNEHRTEVNGVSLVADLGTGHLTIGDPKAYQWRMDFPTWHGDPPAPAITVLLPADIFDQDEACRSKRVVYRQLADLEFLGHDCNLCGGQHWVVVRHEDRVLDLPCCQGAQ